MNKYDYRAPSQGDQHNIIIGGVCEPENPIIAHRIPMYQTIRKKELPEAPEGILSDLAST